VKSGVPYERAFEMSEADVLAHVIVMGSFEGNTFDWHRMRWVEKQ